MLFLCVNKFINWYFLGMLLCLLDYWFSCGFVMFVGWRICWYDVISWLFCVLDFWIWVKESLGVSVLKKNVKIDRCVKIFILVGVDNGYCMFCNDL